MEYVETLDDINMEQSSVTRVNIHRNDFIRKQLAGLSKVAPNRRAEKIYSYGWRSSPLARDGLTRDSALNGTPPFPRKKRPPVWISSSTIEAS